MTVLDPRNAHGLEVIVLEPEQWLRLRTGRAVREDLGTNRVRLDAMTRRHLRVDDGDVVEVRARAAIWARVLPAPAHDEGLGLARLDPDTLREIGVSPGEWVFLRTVEPRPARHVTLRRLTHATDAEHSSESAGSWSLLDGETLIVGDVLRVGAETDRRGEEAHVSVAGLRLVTVDVRRMRFEPATARVDRTEPDGPVRVIASTTVDLLPDDAYAG